MQLSKTLALLLALIGPMASFGLAGVMPPLAKTAEHLPLAEKAMDYLNSGTDPFYAVQTSIDLLKKVGFEEISDSDAYKGKIQPGGLYYFTRNKSTLVAFSVGSQYKPGNGFKVIGGHTDSPNLRVKPRSKRSAAGAIQLGVECYGGGLWNTWFDRCLGISGRVLVRSGDKIEQRLVKIDRSILRISNLAIHLQTAKEREAFAVNKEDHLSPILALEAKKGLTGSSGEEETKEKKPKTEDGWTEYQEPALLQILANELGVETKDIVDFELSLFDIQKANIGGAFSEFVHSARLDNLASCFMAVQALLEHVEEGKVENDSDISMICLYDHEVRAVSCWITPFSLLVISSDTHHHLSFCRRWAVNPPSERRAPLWLNRSAASRPPSATATIQTFTTRAFAKVLC